MAKLFPINSILKSNNLKKGLLPKVGLKHLDLIAL
ncbi:MAG: hypothetical protein CM15mP22_1770 [Gammaproteobacteria bacterium]|nr:MAG: hypothetical protein CM15mP22_1770 [Gammaproteobacteria bacterium]